MYSFHVNEICVLSSPVGPLRDSECRPAIALFGLADDCIVRMTEMERRTQPRETGVDDANVDMTIQHHMAYALRGPLALAGRCRSSDGRKRR